MTTEQNQLLITKRLRFGLGEGWFDRAEFIKQKRIAETAPKLLDALEECVNMLRFHCEVTYYETLGDYMDVLEKADKAIAEAKGEDATDE